MPAYKDEKKGTYYVSFYYTDYTGAKRKKLKCSVSDNSCCAW